LEKWFHVFSWSLPAILVIIVGALKKYGGVNGICFISDSTAQLCGFFVPGLVIVSANTILFFFVAREINETLKGAQDIKGGKKDYRRQFRVYISIVISIGLSWIFGFLYQLFSEVPPVASVFEVLFNITTPLQGFFIFISYCINEKIFKKWAGLFGKCMPCCLKLERGVAGGTTGTTSAGSNSSRVSSSSSRS